MYNCQAVSAIVLSTSSRMDHFYQNVDFFSSSPRLFASAECLKSVKNSRNEGFEEVEN